MRINAHVSRLVAGFAAIYFIWGSTYLAIRIAIESLPPFLMAAVRFLVAGTILHIWVRSREGAATLRPWHWWSGLLTGGFLFLGGNGALVWGEQKVDSGLAALIFSAIPIWMILIDALQQKKVPRAGVLAGVAIGLMGIVVLIGPAELIGGERPDLFASLVLVFGTLSWSLGSLASRWVSLPSSLSMTASIQMLGGGFLLLLFSFFHGETWASLLFSASARSLLALGYLIAFGSLVTFSAYVWLLKATTPGHVSTYALVNPVVAVFLGWYWGGEQITYRILVSIAVILTGVVLITVYGRSATFRDKLRNRKASTPVGGEKACQTS